MHKRTLRLPDASALRALVAQVEAYEPRELVLDGTLNTAIDEAYYGPLTHRCDACGSSGLWFPGAWCDSIDSAFKLAHANGYRLKTLSQGATDVSSIVLWDADGNESHGTGKSIATAVLSAVMRGQLR